MVSLKDGRPLISWTAASVICGALFIPSLSLGVWMARWSSAVDEKLGTLIVSQAKAEANAYPRNVAEAEFRRLDGIAADLKAQIGEANARMYNAAQARSYPSERRGELMRSLKASVEPDSRLFKPQ